VKGFQVTATVILADFRTRTWHREASLEERAAALVEQFNRMADEGTEVVCVPYGGQGIDGIPYEAPENDAS